VPYSSQRSPIADGNARLAFNVLISRVSATALLLVREKDRLRDLEKATSQSHFVRLSDGTAKSVETSSIHPTQSATSSRSIRCWRRWPTPCSRNAAC
jgi:hypothetical protein